MAMTLPAMPSVTPWTFFSLVALLGGVSAVALGSLDVAMLVRLFRSVTRL